MNVPVAASSTFYCDGSGGVNLDYYIFYLCIPILCIESPIFSICQLLARDDHPCQLPYSVCRPLCILQQTNIQDVEQIMQMFSNVSVVVSKSWNPLTFHPGAYCEGCVTMLTMGVLFQYAAYRSVGGDGSHLELETKGRNHVEGPYQGPLQVESSYHRFHI